MPTTSELLEATSFGPFETEAQEAGGALAPQVRSGQPVFEIVEPPTETAPAKYWEVMRHSRDFETFHIEFVDRDGNEQDFFFSLLPAIESNLNNNTSSSLLSGSGARVPEVKPGLLDRLAMKYVRRGVAGAPPAIQSMGIEQRIWQLVGAFIGNEQREPRHPMDLFPPGGWTPEWQPKRLNAYEVANFFTEQVVMVGRPVNITIAMYRPDEDSFIHIKYRGVIQSCRSLHVKADRTYYAFDILITEYYGTEETPVSTPVPDGAFDVINNPSNQTPVPQPLPDGGQTLILPPPDFGIPGLN
jgi:hypothetical protein